MNLSFMKDLIQKGPKLFPPFNIMSTLYILMQKSNMHARYVKIDMSFYRGQIDTQVI